MDYVCVRVMIFCLTENGDVAPNKPQDGYHDAFGQEGTSFSSVIMLLHTNIRRVLWCLASMEPFEVWRLDPVDASSFGAYPKNKLWFKGGAWSLVTKYEGTFNLLTRMRPNMRPRLSRVFTLLRA